MAAPSPHLHRRLQTVRHHPLGLILGSHPNISSGPETRFLANLAHITSDHHWRRIRLYGFPNKYWHERVPGLFHGFQSDYARARGKVRWAAKTPRYALCVDYLSGLFQPARWST
jgi:hypothetical protein